MFAYLVFFWYDDASMRWYIIGISLVILCTENRNLGEMNFGV